ncbi:hypothetical protein skT53_27930 [Effusibacillus dendaii]|uniref:Uncharacterized protein n=1 Tax=Effusibacillus dendaii TaxID=2743772 RepID=A0A7I8DCC9_9BACL|nr:hypothetical protein skT53_27930 [Effusibacillus dendaii]
MSSLFNHEKNNDKPIVNETDKRTENDKREENSGENESKNKFKVNRKDKLKMITKTFEPKVWPINVSKRKLNYGYKNGDIQFFL